MDDFYKKRFAQFGNDVRSLGWGNEKSQQLRLIKLAAIRGIDDIDSTWLDVGCGFGDVAGYFSSKQYTGIDVNEEFLSIAQKNRPSYTFIKTSLEDYMRKHDYVIASGIFCFKEPSWKVTSAIKLRKMYDLCKKGVACNFLTGNGTNPDMHYASVNEVIEMIESITSRYCVIKNYLPNDFTVHMYK